MSKIFLILITIFLFGSFLRFYRLGEIPVGFHRDEAFLGYNAYSILKSGRDITGNFLPLHLKSFLYSPAGYSYFSIPFISVFGINVFSVRFASAFFGSLTIIATYFLAQELFKKNRISRFGNQASSVSILASFLLAISPWHINLSRTATENTVVVFFISLAVLLYIIWIRSNRWHFLLLSFFLFFMTLFIYQAPRAFLPFFIPMLVFIFLKDPKRKNIFIPIILFFVTVIIPLFIIINSRELSLRARTVSIFSTQESQLVIDEQIREDGVFNTSRFIARLFHNKPLIYSQQFMQNYFKHFSYDFLFTDNGYPSRYKVPLVGLIYIFEIPLLIYGIWKLFKDFARIALFIILWILIAPLGSALTFDDVPNLQRSLIAFPAISIVSSYGLLSFFLLLRKRTILLRTSCFIFTLFLIYNVSFYLHQYYVHSSRYRPWYRQDGYKELVEKVNNLLPRYKKAIITDRESSPTIFFLFYSKYNPSIFQSETKGTKIKDFDRISFGQYEFTQEECPLKMDKNGKIMQKNNTIYVNSGLCSQVPIETKAEVKRQDGSVAFRIY